MAVAVKGPPSACTVSAKAAHRYGVQRGGLGCGGPGARVGALFASGAAIKCCPHRCD